MTQTEFIDLIQQTVWLILLLGAPILVTSMVLGIGISIFQAVTQIQEQTLTFVPKILVSFLVFVLTLPWMSESLVTFSQSVLDQLSQMNH